MHGNRWQLRYLLIILGRELRWLLRQGKPHLHLQLASALFIATSSWLYLLDPLVMKWLLDSVLPKRSGRGLLLALSAILACYVGRILFNAAGTLYSIEAGQKTILGLRKRLLRHLDGLSAEYHDREPVGARLYLFTEPMDEIAMLSTDLLPSVLRTTVLTLSILITMLALNTRLTLTILPLIPVFLLATGVYQRQLHSRADRVQQQQSAVSVFMEEHLAGITQLQLLKAERHQEIQGFAKFAGALRAQCALWRTAIRFTLTYNGIIVLGTIAVLGLGGEEFFNGRLSVGGLVAFYTYLTRLFEPLSGAVDLYSRVQRVGGSIRKVMDAFALQPLVKESPYAIVPRGDLHNLTFENVHFAYPGQPGILADLSFEVPPSGRIAVVGENGSGKSTIGKLIARLYDPDTGVIRVDDVDLRHFKTQILRELVCYLPQDAVLFTGSLRDNLLLGNPSASERELTWALEIAGLESVVSRLTGGLYGSLGPRALQISSGERQRIALARGILRRPGVLILDEATSFIDGASEYHILSTLAETLRTTTLIVISHHPSALYWADEILVLDNGRIAERGKHSDLCRNNHLYAQLFNRRLESGRSSPFKEGYSDLPLPRPRSSITNEN